MAVDQKLLESILEKLAGIENLTSKNMFGGVGFFHEGKMFAKMGGSTFRLKVDDSNKKQFEDRGMKPFYSEKKKKGMPYWEVPQEILNDGDQLLDWAWQSIELSKK